MIKRLLLTAFLTAPLFAGEFSIKAVQNTPRELTFTVSYTGVPTEIILPRRARLISYKGQEVSIDTSDKTRIGIRGNTPEGQALAFVYTLYLTQEPAYGNVLEAWYPAVKDGEAPGYLLTVEKDAAFIYPYLAWENGVYRFTSKENPKMAAVRFTRLTEQGTPAVTVYSSLGLEAEPDEIRRIYQHNMEIYGSRGIDELIIINTPRAPEEAWTAGAKVFLSMPARGTIRQFTRLVPEAWNTAAPGISPRIFSLFKDAALRFKPLSTPPNTQGPYVNDPLWTAVSGTKDYYSGLFAKGLDNQGRGVELVDVNAVGILESYPMLELASKHLGVETFFAGMKSLFQNPAPPATNLPDYEQVSWDLLFQNKLSEPLLSFFKKDAFRPGFSASLRVESNIASRNSDFIPNFHVQRGGASFPVEWDGKRAVTINSDAGWVLLDSERLIPRLNYIDSYSTTNTAENYTRSIILEAAANLKTPSVEAFRSHIDYHVFDAPENPYEVEPGKSVYVAVSSVLSTGAGGLKPAIQEAFFVLDGRGRPVSVTTRLRL